jgi:hypothetical protein
MKLIQRILLLAAIVAVTVIGWSLRLRAVEMLPIDYDEDDYLAAAQRYAVAYNAGDLPAVIDYEFTQEHPPLTKITYGLVIKDLNNTTLIPERPPSDPPVRELPEPHLERARLSSAVWGTLEVLALAILNPVAGLLLAVHTWQIKYTSQVMIEPLPAFASLMTVLFYYRARKTSGKPGSWAWMALSAVFLGITAASKYNYAIVGVAMVADRLLEAFQSARFVRGRERTRQLAGPLLELVVWGMLAIMIFVAANPRL